MTIEDSREIAKYFNSSEFLKLPDMVRDVVFANLNNLNTLEEIKQFIENILIEI